MDNIETLKPEELLNPIYVDKIARKCIKYQLNVVTSTSAIAGIPGGFGMLETVPADLIQYYGHVLALTQKLAYLYGYGDFTNDEEQLSDDAINLLTLFVGVGFGSEAAGKAISQYSKIISKGLASKMASLPLTKTALYPIIKKVASYISVKITKDSFAKGVTKVIPFIGAATSGGFTYVTFKIM